MATPLLDALERFVRSSLLRHGASSCLADTPLGRLHYYDIPGSGTAPTTVVVHGFGASSATFVPTLKTLLPHVRNVLLPELPGHGLSDVPDRPVTAVTLFETVRDWLDRRASREPVVLVGNSLGGAFALRYALERPNHVRALGLFSPAGAPLAPVEWEALRGAFALRSRADAMALVTRLYHRVPLSAKLLAHELPAGFARPMQRSLLANPPTDDEFKPAELAALRTPTLFVWGRSERLLPASSLAFFRSYLPTHTVFEEPESMGHCPQVDDPAWFGTRVGQLARSALAS